jgi:hypothetical protein
MNVKSSQLDKLINQALAIEVEQAKETGVLGYVARALAQATMPHSKVEGNEFVRKNGVYTLTMLAPSEVGLPYGSIPRLLIAWLTTEAVKTKKREIVLGDSLSDFMARLGLAPTGGRWGSITRLKQQMRSLFSSMISCSYEGEDKRGEIGFRIADKHFFLWDPKKPNQSDLWGCSVTLTETFFNEITQRPIPIHMEALKILKRSPMALDIYCWLTYRMSYLKKSTLIPWSTLQTQFGADYKEVRYFKRKFLVQLKAVFLVYPEARVEIGESGLILHPSKTHIPKL